jgi:DNA-directed RNA polymerase subunit RPC12/RpoP
MEKIIACPDCGSYNLSWIKSKETLKPQKAKGTLIKPRKGNNKYKCIDCGLEFFESELRE